MFKIEKLILINKNNDEYEYKFTEGVNFFTGPNGCGKTEFSKFLDYMFGDSATIKDFDWYKELYEATLIINQNKVFYFFTRTVNENQNYFAIDTKSERIQCNLDEYKQKLTLIVNNNENKLEELHSFSDINFSVRSFSAFNFLQEDGVGPGYKKNFLTKCNEYKYKKWVQLIIEYIFNENQNEIQKLQEEIRNLRLTIKEQEQTLVKLQTYLLSINNSLQKLSINETVKSISDISIIRNKITEIKKMNLPVSVSINNYQTAYQINELTEKIKLIKNNNKHIKDVLLMNKNRIELLNYLKQLLLKTSNYNELIIPLEQLLQDLEVSVSFANQISNKAEAQRLEKIKAQIQSDVEKNDINNSFIELNEKLSSIAVIEELLSNYEQQYEELNIEDLRKLLNDKIERLEELKSRVNSNLLLKFEEYLNILYKSGINESELIQEDFTLHNFSIGYMEKDNFLLPSIDLSYEDEEKIISKYRGSKARNTLLQLCGYCAFSLLFQDTENIPYMPILIIDHISGPFDTKNSKAIGLIIQEFQKLSKNPIQILFFDIAKPEYFNITPNNYYELNTNGSKGFIPWYKDSENN